MNFMSILLNGLLTRHPSNENPTEHALSSTEAARQAYPCCTLIPMQRNVIRAKCGNIVNQPMHGMANLIQHSGMNRRRRSRFIRRNRLEDCCSRSIPEEFNWQHQMSEIVNNKAEQRFELAADGHIAATYYEVADGVVTFDHTEVPPELGGKGIGSKLVKGALEQVRADGLQVIANCEFVKGYIGKHPEYADLLKG